VIVLGKLRNKAIIEYVLTDPQQEITTSAAPNNGTNDNTSTNDEALLHREKVETTKPPPRYNAVLAAPLSSFVMLRQEL
jgi:hypothetical protein